MSTYTHRSRATSIGIPPQIGGVRQLFARLMLASLMLTGAACESGTFLAGPLTTIGGGIGGSGTIGGLNVGPITAITGTGGIVVNGVTFETNRASITVNGNPASASNLKKGMMVTVSGDGIFFIFINADAVVAGPIQGLSPDRLSLVVLGQLVLIDETAIIDISVPGQSVGNLNIGDLVRVYGLIKDNGVLAATRIDYVTALAEFQVTGFTDDNPGPNFTQNPDPNFGEEPGIPEEEPGPPEEPGTPEEPGLPEEPSPPEEPITSKFAIGKLTVDYSAADINDIGPAISTPGLLLTVAAQNAFAPSGDLLATKVRRGGLHVEGVVRVDIEGFASSKPIAPEGSFNLGDVTVQTKEFALFAGGAAGEIVFGTRLQVAGLLVNDVLGATNVVFRDNIKLESNVTNMGRDRLTLAGLPGVVVTVNGLTNITGARRISDIRTGDHLCIRGRVTTNSVIAQRLEKCRSDTDVMLQAAIDSAVDPNVTLLGVTVDTNTFSDDDFTDLGITPIGRNTFFSTAAVGTLVKANGTLVGETVIWDSLELQQCVFSLLPCVTPFPLPSANNPTFQLRTN